MKIPKKQSDIKVKNYLKYTEVIESLSDEEKEDKVVLLKHTIMIFYEIDSDAFDQLPYTVVMDLYQIIENILKKEAEVVPRFMFNNVEYGLNPDFTDMTLAELVDCDTTDVLKQLCILYRPITKRRRDKYDIKAYEADIDIYDEFKEELTLDVYLGFISFFLSINRDLLSYTQNFIAAMDINQERKKALEVSLDGTLGYIS